MLREIGAPHDLGRTLAKLTHKGGSALDQIQLSLGHGSIQTTERYVYRLCRDAQRRLAQDAAPRWIPWEEK